MKRFKLYNLNVNNDTEVYHFDSYHSAVTKLKSLFPKHKVLPIDYNGWRILEDLITDRDDRQFWVDITYGPYWLKNEVIDKIPKGDCTYYIDYRDDLSGHLKELGDMIHGNDLSDLDNEIYDSYEEQRHLFIKEKTEELINKICELDLGHYSREDIERFMENNDDWIEEKILNNSAPQNLFNELLGNTGRIVARYDTGFEIESETYCWDDERFKKESDRLKKFLQITDDKYDVQIKDIIENSNGGTVKVYFDIQPYVDYIVDNSECKQIKFRNPTLGIVDEDCGSGYTDYFRFHEFTIDFDRKNIEIEKNIKYNWTYNIAGMVESFADQTGIDLI